MSVYKEIRHFTNEINKQSTRVHSDTCDFGVEIPTYEHPLIKQLSGLISLYDMRVEKERVGNTLIQKVYFDGGLGAYFEAGFEQATFTFIKSNEKGVKGHLYVDTFTSKATKRQAANYDY